MPNTIQRVTRTLIYLAGRPVDAVEVDRICDADGDVIGWLSVGEASCLKTPTCEACHDVGWLLQDVDATGRLAIARCDLCQRFDSDNEAVEAVARLAEHNML